MPTNETCERHAWASVGVVDRESVCRVWECEHCPVWTLEPFDPDHKLAWTDTWLSRQ